MKHTLLILNPGHFHAALMFRESHPSLSDEIFVYSEGGPDLDRFVNIVRSYNQRESNPTRWKIHVNQGPDALEKLIMERKGDVVVLAGRNNTRMELIERLNGTGFSILADKPWVTTDTALPYLNSAMNENRPLTLDFMTERYEITNILQKRLVASKDIFGEVRVDTDGSPSVIKESVHHLYKIVNNKPLVRPPWYFDAHIQGEGIIDVSTHLVDLTHWMLFPATLIDYTTDIQLLDGRRWATNVPLDTFRKITLADGFPDSVMTDVAEDTLHYFCNGDIQYRVKGVPVHIRVLWNLEIPEGGGDTHYSYIKGTRSDLLIRQLPETGFRVELLVIPRVDPDEILDTVKNHLALWSETYPGLAVQKEKDKLRIRIPDVFRTTHEEHFYMVRNEFFEYLDAGIQPPEVRSCIVSKYTLLAKAQEKALASPFEPLTLPEKIV